MNGSADSCPTNLAAVADASRRLGCSRDQYGNDQYLCVPNSNKSALLESCYHGIMGIVNADNCLEINEGSIKEQKCTGFAEGCPNVNYNMDEIYKYPACLRINTDYRCYLADLSCQNIDTTLSDINGSIGAGPVAAIVIITIVFAIVIIVGIICVRKRRKKPKKMDDLEKELKPLTSNELKISTENENKSDNTEVEKLKKQCDEKDTELAKLRSEMEALLKARDTETEQKEELIQKQEKLKLNLQQQFLAENKERKELNNKLQEAKGNIRVLCRIRKTDEVEKCLTVSGNSISMQSTGKPNMKLTFEKVFEENSKQRDVYSEIRELIRSFLDGYNVCIFAYGQTGSGKTYTMDGGSESEDAEGVIPRAIKQVFEDSEAAICGGWIYKFSASYLELYNEKIRDLAKGADDKKPREIKGTVNGKVYVDNLTTCEVHTKDEVMKFYKEASKNRTSSKTRMNEESSRSHAVFRLEMKGSVEDVQDRHDTCSGTLTLVDLAGSEKIDQEAGTTTNLETNKINLSLLELGRVLRSLLKKETVTYRNSVLTRLLHTSLGGNSKTLIIVNVSPSMACQRETERSLEFGSEICEQGGNGKGEEE